MRMSDLLDIITEYSKVLSWFLRCISSLIAVYQSLSLKIKKMLANQSAKPGIYKKLFSHYKNMERHLYPYCGPFTNQDYASFKKDWSNLLNYLARNLCSLSPRVKDCAIRTKDLMAKCVTSETKNDGVRYCEKFQQELEILDRLIYREIYI